MRNHQSKIPRTNVRGLAAHEIDCIADAFAPEIAEIFDRCFITTDAGFAFVDNAASEIATLLMGKGTPLAVAILAAGTGKSPDAIGQTHIVFQIPTLAQIVSLTFPGAGLIEIAEAFLPRVLRSAADQSAAASGNHSKH